MSNNNRPQDYGRDDKKAPPQQQQGTPGQQQPQNPQQGGRKDMDRQGLNREKDPQDTQRRSGAR